MKRLLLMFVGALAFVAACLPASAPAGASAQLIGTVGPRATLTLTANGQSVHQLVHGAYVIVVRDRSRKCDFHLQRATVPGARALNRRTGIRFVGTVTWRVTLSKGTYYFVCDTHSRTLHGVFRVT